MTPNNAYTAIFNILWNKAPAHRNKEALQEIKAILKQVQHTAIDQILEVLKESRTFGIEEEIEKIIALKEKI